MLLFFQHELSTLSDGDGGGLGVVGGGGGQCSVLLWYCVVMLLSLFTLLYYIYIVAGMVANTIPYVQKRLRVKKMIKVH